jgi:cyclophilin family peptidyl-prolyl cis-trans isomerase
MVKLLPPESAEIVVFPLLEDSSEYVRARICEAYGSVRTHKILRAMRQILGGVTVPGGSAGGRERAAAAHALGELDSNRARPELLAALADDEVAVVATAAEALAKIGVSDSVVVDALIEAVRHNQSPNEPDIAVAGLSALGEMKAIGAESLATELLASPQPQIREAARECLVSVVGEERAAELAESHQPAPWRPAAVAPYRAGPPDARRAILRTSRGDITLELYSEESPRTVENFVRLAEEGYYDNVAFHRVVPNFVIQDGDPTGVGWGGPGYAIRCEYNLKQYGVGAVGMALAGKDTGGSQYFITHSPQPRLNGRYTIFAQVVEGLENVSRIQVGDLVYGIEIER